jgi:hypothetical protein
VEEWILARGERVLLSTHGYPVHEELLRRAAMALVARGRLREERRFPGAGGAWSVWLRVVAE